jgi:hypothetical protein
VKGKRGGTGAKGSYDLGRCQANATSVSKTSRIERLVKTLVSMKLQERKYSAIPPSVKEKRSMAEGLNKVNTRSVSNQIIINYIYLFLIKMLVY